MKLLEDYGMDWSHEGDIAFVERKYELARKAYSEASRYIPNNPFIMYKLGRTLDAMGHKSEASSYYNRALKINPDLTEKRFAKADNELRETLRLNQKTKGDNHPSKESISPKKKETITKKTNSTVQKDPPVKQEKQVKKKTVSNKKRKAKVQTIDIRPILSEGDRLIQFCNYSAAMEKYRQCQEIDPSDPSVVARMSALSFRMGNEVAAEEAIQNMYNEYSPPKEDISSILSKKSESIQDSVEREENGSGSLSCTSGANTSADEIPSPTSVTSQCQLEPHADSSSDEVPSPISVKSQCRLESNADSSSDEVPSPISDVKSVNKHWLSRISNLLKKEKHIISWKKRSVDYGMIEDEVDKAIRLINSNLPGADAKRAKDLLAQSAEELENNNLSKSLDYAIQAQLAANPTTDHLLNNAKIADDSAQKSFTEGCFSKAIERWGVALENYHLAEELAKARNQKDDLNTIHLLIEKIHRNIETATRSDQNHLMVKYINKGNTAIREGNNSFRNASYLDAISRYERAEEMFMAALEIAENDHFGKSEEIKLSLDTIGESIKSSHFGYVNMILENAGKEIESNPERIESQYYAAVQYLNKLDYSSDDIYSHLMNTAHEGIIRSKILQAKHRIESGKKILEKREFHNGKEHYRSILEYLNTVYDEALGFGLHPESEEVKTLIGACNTFIDQARSGMLHINEVQMSVETPDEILQGGARFDDGKLVKSGSSNGGTNKPKRRTTPPQELFSRYSDVELIATGGFGEVYKVRRPDGVIAAVKIPTNLDSETGNIFIREVGNWTKIDKHTNVVSIYDYNVVPVPYIEMEYCENSLAGIAKPVDPATAARYIFDLCEGLKIAHRRNIIHRDLKPQNVLLKDNSIRIGDWGLSKAISDASSSITTDIKGTIKYVAPEQLDNRHKDERTDIWQVGILFYELVTGTLPFTGDGFSEIASAISLDTPISPSEYDPGLKEFDAIILKCLEKDPDERYRTVEELQKELATYLSLSYTLSFEKSITRKDIRNSAIFCVDLVITHLKVGNLTKAYFYCDDLKVLIKGQDKRNIASLQDQIHLRIEEGFDDAPEELVMLAERISNKISLGTLGVERKIREDSLKFGHQGKDVQGIDSLFE